MKRRLVLSVSLEEANAIVQNCRARGRTPLSLLLDSSEFNREPYLFKIENLVRVPTYTCWEEMERGRTDYRSGKGEQNKVYLELLSQLLAWGGPKVEAALARRRGNKRVYFSKNGDEVSQAKLIPGADWYACTQLSVSQKGSILAGLMRSLGFSWSYSDIMSRLPNEWCARVGGLLFEEES